LTDEVLVWLAVWSEVQIVCGPADATAIPKPHYLLLHLNQVWFKIQTGFTFLVPAYPGCSGKEAVKQV